MTVDESLKPKYDERVNEILEGLEKGTPRDELAITFGHKNYKTLDIYMRRRNFTWDSISQTYIPKISNCKKPSERVMPTSKVGTVIEMMTEEDFDIDVICQKVGLRDHRDLAEYMTSKGYIWSPEKRNYVQKLGEINTTPNKEIELVPKLNNIGIQSKREVSTEFQTLDETIERLEGFMPLFELLASKQDKLMEMLSAKENTETLPRYIVPGRTSGKTIQMSEALQDMAVTFCNERNIKQRELFEIALIEFFKKSGYEYEVANLIQSH